MSDKTNLPSKEELAELPRASIVVYAYRCALRVQPLMVSWRNPSTDYKKAVVKLCTIYKYLNLDVRAISNKAAYDDAYTNANVAAYAAAAARAGDEQAAYSNVAHYVTAAARATYEIADTKADTAIDDYIVATDAAEQAVAAYADASNEDDDATDAARAADIDDANAAARADYIRLYELKSEVTDASETGPLGNLWYGSPPGWYIEAKEYYSKTISEWERELRDEDETEGIETFDLEINVPDELGKQAAFECISILGAYIDDLHKAKGGSGVEIEFLEIHEPEGVPVPLIPEVD